MKYVIAILFVLIAVPAWATHDTNPNDCTCPNSWSPEFDLDCTDPALPYACGGAATGAPECVGSLPSCPNGYLDCDSCSYVAYTPTRTNTPLQSNTPTPTATPTITNTPANTNTPTATNTVPTSTPTDTPTITNTPTVTPTPTITETPTVTPTFTIIPCTATDCGAAGEELAYCFSEGFGSPTTFDWSFHDHLGTMAGSVPPAWTTSGKYGNGLVFDGNNAHGQAVTFGPNDTFDSLTSGTVMAWVNLVGIDSGALGNDVVVQGTDGSDFFQFYVFSTDSGANWGLAGYSGPAGSNKDCFTGGTAFSGSAWHHVALTVTDASTHAFYVDGAPVAEAGCDGVLPSIDFFAGGATGTTQYAVGQESSSSTQTLNGTIDDLRIYSKVLTAAEINAAMGTSACMVAPTPTPGTGGGSLSCADCTRIDATHYTCGTLTTISTVQVGNDPQVIKGSCGHWNVVTVSGNIVTSCYSLDDSMGPVKMTVRACGS